MVGDNSNLSSSSRRLGTCLYPGNPDEGDATFHGSVVSETFAESSDAADDLLDGFPVHDLVLPHMYAASAWGRPSSGGTFGGPLPAFVSGTIPQMAFFSPRLAAPKGWLLFDLSEVGFSLPLWREVLRP